MLVTNIVTLIVLLLLLTVVPMIPGMIVSRFLSGRVPADPALGRTADR
jgi:hypothetical protein